MVLGVFVDRFRVLIKTVIAYTIVLMKYSDKDLAVIELKTQHARTRIEVLGRNK